MKRNSPFMSIMVAILLWAVGTVWLRGASATNQPLAEAFIAECAQKAKDALSKKQPATPGKDGWLFLTSELAHIGAGAFWGEKAAAVSKASKPEWADPTPAILDFHKQLAAKGIDLLLAPVPPKAFIYPDKLSDAIQPDDKGNLPRLDIHHQAFYEVLRKEGVQVLDLYPAFQALRLKQESGNGNPSVYCKQDSHWAWPGIVETAAGIEQALAKAPWLQAARDRTADDPIAMNQLTVTLSGDLWKALSEPHPEQETLTIPTAPDSILDDRDSPVLLLGDSHTLFLYSGGDMAASKSGLMLALRERLGFPVDLLGVRGSGATPARLSLFRRSSSDNAYLSKKKLVIWCFTAREFTEASGWRVLPIER